MIKRKIDLYEWLKGKVTILVLIMGLFSFACEEQLMESDCVYGRYVGEYCEGVVVQILDDHKIGNNWQSMFSDETYSNSVVASIDTLMAKKIDSGLFSEGSEFHFKYKDGGYGRKQYSVCEPSASITITYLSEQPCVKNDE